ncbi:hypothetical protein NP493_115g05039 [Ridgeia piscesae]|uniref:Uncharacterized protein n=1 Tax=Ridgeia piscesae TaxID=27915 RepID=A0AAD9UH77_RIDPI|nr:hypothetical protein NP493_115g05039 [Ridgeia piscesae]
MISTTLSWSVSCLHDEYHGHMVSAMPIWPNTQCQTLMITPHANCHPTSIYGQCHAHMVRSRLQYQHLKCYNENEHNGFLTMKPLLL